MNYAKYPPLILAACAGLIGLTTVAVTQELFGVYSDYHQRSGNELLANALEESEAFDMLKLGVRTSARYDNNIFLASEDEESDLIFSLDFIMGIENKRSAQNHWKLSYIPTFKYYTNNSSLNGIDHNLFGSYSRTFSKTQVDLVAEMSRVSGSNRFVSGQIDKYLYGVNLGVSHVLTGKSRLDLDLGYRGEDFDDDSALFDRYTYNARLAWQYQWTGKTTIGPYVGYEYVSVNNNPDEKAWSVGAEVFYQAFAKTSFSGSVGVENRSFTGSGSSSRTGAVWRLAANHNYSPKTNFNVSLYRSVSPSASIEGNGYTATGITFNANHLTTERLTLRTRMSFEHDDYFGINRDGAADSNYYSISVGGQYRASNGLILGSDVTWREQFSDASANEFTNVSLQLSASYYF